MGTDVGRWGSRLMNRFPSSRWGFAALAGIVTAAAVAFPSLLPSQDVPHRPAHVVVLGDPELRNLGATLAADPAV